MARDRPENLDPFIAVVDVQRTPPRPAARAARGHPVRLHRLAAAPACWLLAAGETEICKTYPGLDEDLYITAEAEAFVKWHAGQLTWAEALRDSRIRLDGPSWLVRAFPTWNARSTFAHIKPVAGSVCEQRQRSSHSRHRAMNFASTARLHPPVPLTAERNGDVEALG